MYEETISELEQTAKELLQSFNGLSEAQVKYKINPQVWSIHECMEHIAITEIAVYRILMQHSDTDTPSAIAEKVGKEKIERILSNRTVKTESPDDIKPIGRFSSMAELNDKFTSNRQRITDALTENRIVFGSRIIMHPMLGEMTKKDWLNFLIHHSKRHCKQIEEIKSVVRFQMI